MDVRLSPVVRDAIAAFVSRRRTLNVLRAVATGLLVLIVAAAIVAAVDWRMLLGDRTRWLLSAGVYALAALTTGTLLLAWLRREDDAAVAGAIQSHLALDIDGPPSRDAARDQVRAAVELAADSPSEVEDSPVFRAILQSRAAQQLRGVEVSRLLPLRLIAAPAVAAVGLVALAAGIIAIGGPTARQLAMRTLLPGANVARVSRVTIEIVEPSPPGGRYAAGDTLSIVASVSRDRVTGEEVDAATLELRHDGEIDAFAMLPRDADESHVRFGANVTVPRGVADYRVLSGDGITRWHTIEGHERPHVVALSKRYTPPPYAEQPPYDAADDSGDLIALAGSTAELTLRSNQPLASAGLEIAFADADRGDDRPTGPATRRIELLATDDPLLFRAIVPIHRSGTYEVALASKQTGLTNRFASRHEIRPLADLRPRVRLLTAWKGTLLLRDDAAIAMQAEIEDDLPVRTLTQAVRINGGPWQTIPRELAEDDATLTTAGWSWRLDEIEWESTLQTGDEIETRLAATDRRGQIGETPIFRAVVAGSLFAPARHDALRAKLAVLAAIDEAASEVATIAEGLGPNADRVADPAARPLMAGQVAAIAERLDRAIAAATTAMADLPEIADAADVTLAADTLAAVHVRHMAALRTLLDRAADLDRQPDGSGQAAAIANEIRRHAAGLPKDLHQIAERFRDLAAPNIGFAVQSDLDAMRTLHAELPPLDGDDLARVRRRILLLTEEMANLSRLLGELQPSATEHVRRQLTSTDQWLLRMRSELTDGLAELADDPTRRRPVRQASDRVARELQYAGPRNLTADVINPVAGRRAELAKLAGSPAETVREASQWATQAAELRGRLAEASDTVTADAIRGELIEPTARLRHEMTAAADRFDVMRSTERAGTTASTARVADDGLTLRALRAVTDAALDSDSPSPRIDDPAKAFDEIATAYETLRAGHSVRDAIRWIASLAEAEQLRTQSPSARWVHPRTWHLIRAAYEDGRRRLDRTGFEGSIGGRLDQAFWSTDGRRAQDRLSQRPWKRDEIIPVDRELSQLGTALSLVARDLDAPMRQARETIAKYVPTIAELAAAAAEQADAAAERSQQAADRLDAKAEPDDSADARDAAVRSAAETQESLARDIADLFEVLAEEANRQDVLDESSREIARDADLARELIREPAEQAAAAVSDAEAARAAEADAAASEWLDEAADRQQETAAALRRVAEHFERLHDDSMPADQTRDQLRGAAERAGLAGEVEDRFEQAERLAARSQQSADELRAELERELDANPAMRDALGEIAEQAIDEAAAKLREAAATERSIRDRLERSDDGVRGERERVAEAMRQLGREVRRVAHSEIEPARQAAERGRSKQTAAQLQDAKRRLEKAAASLEAVAGDAPRDEAGQRAADAAAELAAAAGTLDAAVQSAQKASGEAIAEGNAERAQRQNETRMQGAIRQSQRKQAEGETRRTESERRRADQRVAQARRDQQSAEKRLRDAKKKAEQKPDDRGRQSAVERERKRGEQAAEKLAAAIAEQAAAKDRVAEATRTQAEVSQRPRSPLEQPNPSAELATTLAAEGKESTSRAAKAADALAQAMGNSGSLQADAQRLAEAAARQDGVARDVDASADDLERAATHRERLGQDAASATGQAAEVRSKATPQVGNASKQIRDASQRAESNGQSTAEAQPAANALSQTQQTLEQLAKSIGASDAEADTPHSPAGGQPSEASQMTAAAQSRGRQMAQLLDRLDRLQQASPSGQPPAERPQQQTTASTSGESRAARPIGEASPAGEPSQQVPSSLFEAAAAAEQATMAAARAAATAEAQAAVQGEAMPGESAAASESDSAVGGFADPEAEVDAFNMARIDRRGGDWGQLRSQRAEDVTTGRGEVVAEDYRPSVDAYFRILSERARSGEGSP